MMRNHFTFVVVLLILFSSPIHAEKRIKQGMTAQEVLPLIEGVEVEESHQIWRSPTIIDMASFVNLHNTRIFQKTTSSNETIYQIVEFDDNQKFKNLYFIERQQANSYSADVMGTYAEVFNTIKKGDDYKDVVKKVGYGTRKIFFCEDGVWYVRDSYYIGRMWCPITFFAATGKVAHIVYIDLDYFRSPESEVFVRITDEGSIEAFSH